ncbi:lysine--tRNA ligase [Coralliovum pocilloporae]|uniref:lysine--tRNA ligase n=1 Tax=Coralliovum pocilloporae TaxID=3066369 RepID=UPI0033071C0B
MTTGISPDLVDAARTSKAWPFEEARKVVARLEKQGKPDKTVIFETGYGPSGLPHIGTFGEVARTTMVRHAFNLMTDNAYKTRLICFSDDMDGFRKVPSNVPNGEELEKALGQPLTKVPDPFGEYPSFAHHNNARLRMFLDQFGFDYEFASATDAYTSGQLDEALLRMLAVYDKVMDIILPTLGAERQKTYSPFLPVCPRTGVVLQVPMIERNVEAGTVVYEDPETGERMETPVTGGRVKCQWKADWALRWFALGVDYEMAGKDLIDSVNLSGRICRAMGGTPPENLSYELFLDEKGEKISKSKGNGLTIEEWLTYASPESLSLFMFQKPRTAKKLYFDVIPKNVDEYFTFLDKAGSEEGDALLKNPAWHIHSGDVPGEGVPVSFSMLLNLVSASNSEDKAVLWGFIRRYAPDVTPESNPVLDNMVGYAIRYFEDFVKPNKVFRLPTDLERDALEDLDARLDALPADADAETIQNEVYAVGKAHAFDNLRDWFKALYQVLLGQDQGPRFGSFVALYGIEETRVMIGKGLSGELAE